MWPGPIQVVAGVSIDDDFRLLLSITWEEPECTIPQRRLDALQSRKKRMDHKRRVLPSLVGWHRRIPPHLPVGGERRLLWRHLPEPERDIRS